MARGYKNISFEWNDSRSMIIKNLGFGQDLNRDAAKILARISEPYVPYKTGNLNSSMYVRATSNMGQIVYTATDIRGRAYSGYQYNLDYGNPEGNDKDVMRTRTVHELATSRWCDWAWYNHKAEITHEVDEARLKYRKPTKSNK